MPDHERRALQDNRSRYILNALTVWGQSIDSLESIVDPQRIKILSEPQRKFFDDQIKDDITQMMKKFPELKTKWL